MSRTEPAGLRLVVALVAMLAPGVPVSAGEELALHQAITPRQAIEQAVAERLGPGVVRVDVETVDTSVPPAPGLVAATDPAGFVGRRARFALMVNGQRRGTAVALVTVRARVVRTTRAIDRAAVIAAGDVMVEEAEVSDVRFGRVPQLEEVVGARARRALVAGTAVTEGMVAAPPDVQNGERVVVGVTVGRVHVTGEGIASGSGQVGDVVHVLQPGRRGRLRARVVERGVVEVMP